MDNDYGDWITCPECKEPYDWKNGRPTHHCPLQIYTLTPKQDEEE